VSVVPSAKIAAAARLTLQADSVRRSADVSASGLGVRSPAHVKPRIRAPAGWHHRAMSEIRQLDFLGVPSRDADRARAFYRDTLGLRADEHAEYECWAGETCLAIWMPEQIGMTFVAQKGNPLPLGVEDVGAARAALEAKGVTFSGDTLDTGVCHMAFFTDPDGNDLMLHHRYAPYPDRQSA
jgi:catechol 2,3-dioxygenase-like lactoylglutathione lyase family enzyme